MNENVSTVGEIYAAFGRGDVPAILSRLADDVAWEHDFVDHGIPWIKARKGHEEVVGFFRDLAALQITKFTVLNLLAGGNQVASVIELEATVVATGKRIRDLEMHLWTFAEDGRVSRFRHVADTHQHLLACRP